LPAIDIGIQMPVLTDISEITRKIAEYKRRNPNAGYARNPD